MKFFVANNSLFGKKKKKKVTPSLNFLKNVLEIRISFLLNSCANFAQVFLKKLQNSHFQLSAILSCYHFRSLNLLSVHRETVILNMQSILSKL